MATEFFSRVSSDEFEELLAQQTYSHQVSPVWDEYTKHLPERELWQASRWVYQPEDGTPAVAMTLREFTLRRMTFLWMQDGPVWVGRTPDRDEEQRFIERLGKFIAGADPRIAFIRFNAYHEHAGLAQPCQDLFFHDTTVVISLEGEEADLLARMKKRGRRDLSRAQRLGGIEVRDCTDVEHEVFERYLDIMDETSERQNFTSLSRDQYWTFFSTMRELHAVRLYVGFLDDQPVNWGIFTIHNNRAQYEIAAGNEEARKAGAANLVVYRAMCDFQKEGIRELDLIAIGSDYNPRLNSLNLFKTQWTKETTYVGRPMELVLKPAKYTMMNTIARLMGR